MRSQRVKRVKRSKKSKMLKRKQINRRTKRVSKVKRTKRPRRSRRSQINRRTKRFRKSQINRRTRRTRRTRRMRGGSGSGFREKKLLEQSHLTPEEMAQYRTYVETENKVGGYGTTSVKATKERQKLDILARQRLKAAGGIKGPNDHSDPPPQPTEPGVSSVTSLEDLSGDLSGDLPEGLFEDLPELTPEEQREFESLGSELDTPVGGGARPPQTLGVLGGPVESGTLEQKRQEKKSNKKEQQISEAFNQLVRDNKWRVPTKAEAAGKGSGDAIMGKTIWVSDKSLNSEEDIDENPARGKVGRVTGYNSKWKGASTHTIEGVQESRSEGAMGRLKYPYYPLFDPDGSDPKICLYRSSKEKVPTSKKYPFLIKCEGAETPSTLEEIRNWIENGQPWPPP